MFQSRSGFSARRDQPATAGGYRSNYVSIPFWVFCPSRHLQLLRLRGRLEIVSIPFWVFCPSRRGTQAPIPGPRTGFQSRSGFSARRDLTGRVMTRQRRRGFNPVLGFLPVATTPRAFVRGFGEAFQSRSGFSARRDPRGLPDDFALERFQSRSGFSARRDVRGRIDRRRDSRFQSRSGFSARRDRTLPRLLLACSSGFNPVLGFLPVATSAARTGAELSTGFNPVLGFLPVATHPSRPSGMASTSFNPVLGFLPVATG